MSEVPGNRQVEAFLRFYATMTNAPFDDVVDEYLGKASNPTMVNRLYAAVHTAVAWMNEADTIGGKSYE